MLEGWNSDFPAFPWKALNHLECPVRIGRVYFNMLRRISIVVLYKGKTNQKLLDCANPWETYDCASALTMKPFGAVVVVQAETLCCSNCPGLWSSFPYADHCGESHVECSLRRSRCNKETYAVMLEWSHKLKATHVLFSFVRCYYRCYRSLGINSHVVFIFAGCYCSAWGQGCIYQQRQF